MRAFKKIIEKDNLILVALKDYEKFKKKVWIDFLSQIKNDAIDLNNFYKSKKKELQKIIIEAKAEIAIWENIVKTFNSRFYVPFEVILTNQDDIILKLETANIEFDYIEKNEIPFRQKKEALLNILSKGEQRAYFILQFLFEIESKKISGKRSLIIFDDIADSFDYKNKFAIIEYIKDLNISNQFRMVILTHNFDFYRTIASRLHLNRNVVFMTTKSDDKLITFHNGQYRNDVFTYFLDNFNNPKVFISLIAFIRNIVEYLDSTKCTDYSKLTCCLHKKTESETLTAQNIFDVFSSRIIKLAGKTIPFGQENIIDLIKNTADEICSETHLNEILLENKITLAIAIRIKAEEYFIKKMPDIDLTLISVNQTNKLFQEYKRKYLDSPNLNTLDKVNLMTPENIHLNSFMYEPLIDMSVLHLKNLYNDLSQMN